MNSDVFFGQRMNFAARLRPLLSLALYAVLSLGVLSVAGCGGKEEKPAKATKGSKESKKAKKERKEKDKKDAASSSAGTPGKSAATLDGNQWVSWRGPEQNGVSRAKGLPESWKTETENLLWKAPVGGRSTPIIMDGRVFVIHLTGDKVTWQEEVVCLNADTGEIIWRHAFDLFHTDVPADRVGWASLAGDPETGYVYAHGVQGLFFCFDRDGKIIWQKSLTEEFGRISGYGGRTHTPIVDRDLVILGSMSSGLGDQAPGRHRYWAMNKRTGEMVWEATPGQNPEDTTFSTPIVAIVNGVRMLITPNGDGWVYALKIATGEKIWSFQMSRRGINSSAVMNGNNVIVCHSEDNIDNTKFGRVVCIDATGHGNVTKTHEVWRRDDFAAGYVSATLAEGKVYAVDNAANMICLNVDTGKELWALNVGKVAWGSPVWADGKLYYPEVNGNFLIIKPGDTEGKIISQIHFEDPSTGLVDIRGCPAVAYGRLYVLTRLGLYCLGKKDAKPEPIAIPALPDDGPASGKATAMLVTPAEVQIAKGETPKFSATLFDDHGRKIGAPKEVAWSLGGLKGDLAADAAFKPDPAINGQFGIVKALVKADDAQLTAGARVRVLPDLPITEDFEKIPEGGSPSYWVGASKLKFQTVVENGNHIWKKDAADERFLRALVYMGAPSMKNYTVQADVRNSMKRRHLPDAGLINSRYVLELHGNDDQLRIISWVSMPRIVKTIPFTTEKDVWYTMKCRVDYEGDKGIVRGKVWKRDEPEPAAWTIELEDPMPHREGSPGLACYALAEIFFDNVKVEKSN